MSDPITIDELRVDNDSPGGFVIVPNNLRDAINAKLDVEIARHPAAAKDRDILYKQLIWFFGEYGHIPDFTLEPKAAP